jgi:hypothetical protein
MPEPGELRRKRLLGSDAIYRVVALEGELVTVEVVQAPGLSAGERFRFTLEAVTAMEVVRS